MSQCLCRKAAAWPHKKGHLAVQARWGAAYALGPNYNEMVVEEDRLDAARAHIAAAADLLPGVRSGWLIGKNRSSQAHRC
jgi:hypothetical protein